MNLTKDGNDGASGPERRHQIPGLRQTPYVKIYLLRCDDHDTYKASCRKQVRDWIKDGAQPGESRKGQNNQESHDAFGWLIVHVVVPESPAIAQSQKPAEARLGTTDSSDSIISKSKWPGKGSSTVIEKLRADFNGGSKSGIDRVAQIFLPEAEKQASADDEDCLLDLVEKLKVTILTSFDLRVKQYEEDIQERDSQRSLPGWNFNTFFMLKEGLARGFENVGLFDDALAGYDELALGLEIVVREHLDGQDHGSRFLPFSEELKNKVQACLKDTNEGTQADTLPSFDVNTDPAGRLPRRDYPLDTTKTPFRELILANDISIFDFRLYIFSRQLELLLRSANASSIIDQPSESRSGHSKHEEYFLPLAEACQRGLDFITSAARTLRHDLELALDVNEPKSLDEKTFRRRVISNFTLSWMYVSSLQILAQTSSSDLALPSAEALHSSPATAMKLNLPERQEWSPSRTPSPTGLNTMCPPLMSGTKRSRPNSKSASKTGVEELAGARAELYLLARTAMQQIGYHHGWLRRLDSMYLEKMQNVSLETGNHPTSELGHEQTRTVINGLQYLDLRDIFQAPESSKALYSCLTTFSYRHSLAANRTQFAEKGLAELAMLRYESGEYEAAASFLGRLALVYRNGQWAALEATLLELYSNCMKKLGRHGEYVSSLLALLSQLGRHQQKYPGAASDTQLADLWSFSEKLTTTVSAKLSDFFSIKGLAPDVCLYPAKDGFYIPLDIKFLFGDSVEILEGVQMTISPIHDSTMPSITLRSPSIAAGRSLRRIELSSNCSVCGWYAIDNLRIKVSNIVFLEDYKALRLSFEYQPKMNPHASLSFYVYPSQRSLQAIAYPAQYLHLAKPRSILVELKTGWNEIEACTFSMKSGTAGLRLRLGEARIDSDNGHERPTPASDGDSAQTIRLSNYRANSTVKLTIPYTMENAELPVIYAKLEVDYTTANGAFIHSTLVSVNTILPISVNVQDLFQENALLSRFTISPATLVPLRLWSCKMQGWEDVYSIESQPNVQGAMDVFPKQPASLMYKFARLGSVSRLKDQAKSLEMAVSFSCLDEVVLRAIEKRFIASIDTSIISSLVQPLCAHLLSTFRSQWSAQDLEVIGLCHEIEIWPYEDLGWDAVLLGFNVKVRNQIRSWLKKWHSENVVIPIYTDPYNETDTVSRLIVIPVEIPTPTIVITASLKVDSGRPDAVIIGEAILAELQISHTRDWAGAEGPTPETAQLQISFEVLAPFENWVIGGVRKGLFPANGEVQSMPIILLPQRAGHLLLPSVDVKCYQAGTFHNGIVPTDGMRVPCEFDMKSLAQSVHVVSGLIETIVEIAVDADGQGQGASERRSWLAGSKGREES